MMRELFAMTAIFWNFYSQTITVHCNDKLRAQVFSSRNDRNPLGATLQFRVNISENEFLAFEIAMTLELIPPAPFS